MSPSLRHTLTRTQDVCIRMMSPRLSIAYRGGRLPGRKAGARLAFWGSVGFASRAMRRPMGGGLGVISRRGRTVSDSQARARSTEVLLFDEFSPNNETI